MTLTDHSPEYTLPMNSHRALDDRLHGSQLMLARVVWFSVAAVGIASCALSIPIRFAQLEQVCTGAACAMDMGLLRPQDLTTLEQWGLSPTFYAALVAALFVVVALTWIIMGLLLFWRQSAELRVYFFSLFLMVFGTQYIDPLHTLVVAQPIWWLPVAALGFLSDAGITLFGYVFPNGRFVPRWIRWPALVAILIAVPYHFFPGSPLSKATWPDVVAIPIAISLPVSIIVAQVYRYRWRSTPVERQQTKWVALALVALLLLVLVWVPIFSVQATHLLTIFTFGVAFQLAVLLIPLAIAAAIVRYRLWDIDALINKALVYGTLTALLAAVYAGLIIGLENLAGLFARHISDNSLALVISTLAVVVLVQPLRRSIQRLIDRRFYRSKYDAQRTLAQFSARLRSEVDLGQLSEQLVMVVDETMQPEHVSLWLKPRDQRSAHLDQPS